MNKNDKILTLSLTRENAEYLISLVCSSVFSCYKGNKDASELAEYPEYVEQNDFDDIALPYSEVKKAKTIVMDLQKLLYSELKI